MGLLLAVCYLITFSLPPKTDDGTGGILVNYGTTEEGSGSDFMSMEEPSKSEKPSKTNPDKVTPTTQADKSAENSNQKVVTQNTEDAPAVNDKKNTSTTSSQAEAPQKQHTVNQAALFKGMKNTGTGQGDGTTNTPGNQGSPNGSNLSDNYGPGGSGGNGLNMPHWTYVNPPSVKNVHRQPGTVVIDFIVDPSGNVIQHQYNRRKTRASLELIQSCDDAIANTRFTPSVPTSNNTKGEYTFIFKVN